MNARLPSSGFRTLSGIHGKPTQPRAQQAERFLVFLKSLLARCQKLRSAELTLTLSSRRQQQMRRGQACCAAARLRGSRPHLFCGALHRAARQGGPNTRAECAQALRQTLSLCQMPEPGHKDDTATRAVADFLRNEKGSGLRTKEAVQYEKARDRSLPLPLPSCRPSAHRPSSVLVSAARRVLQGRQAHRRPRRPKVHGQGCKGVSSQVSRRGGKDWPDAAQPGAPLASRRERQAACASDASMVPVACVPASQRREGEGRPLSSVCSASLPRPAGILPPLSARGARAFAAVGA